MSAMRTFRRVVFLIGLVAAGLGVMSWARSRPRAVAGPPRLTYVTTAHQLGVVGYRDPVGVISPDGRLVAFAEGRRLFETSIGGGVRVEITAAEGQIRHVAPRGPSGEWIFEDGASATRWWIASARSPVRPLFGTQTEVEATLAGDSATTRRRVNALRQVVASSDGQWLAGTASGPQGAELWRLALDGSRTQLARIAQPIASPAWSPAGDVACTVNVNGRWRLSTPCGDAPLSLTPDVEVIGPLAFSNSGRAVFFASPNPAGFVDLWEASLDRRDVRRLTTFARDTYAPSTSAGGTVLLKTQSYRTAVAEMDLTSGISQQLSTLQAETPSYHPDGHTIAVTYGTWRRVIDDAKYPDIAQEIGLIRSMPIDRPADAPTEVIADSDSEDQAMAWSPNGRWIAFHSHRDQSDDIWLRPTDKHAPDRRVSFLGSGAEVGWPRWSPDGRWVLYDGASPTTRRSVVFVIGIDQETGDVTAPPREVRVTGFDGEITHAEWLPDSATIVAIAREAPGRHAVLTAPVAGGAARIVHRFATEHDFPGLASSPDGRFVAMVGPAPDGFFQIFKLPIAGGTPEQLTFDRSHKTQPAWSPDGRRLAYTVWSYEAQFWTMKIE